MKNKSLIAPCGINCSLCYAYLREKNHCPGCRFDDAAKSKARITCAIKTCKELLSGKHQFCDTCETYPCYLIRRLDKRYKLKYGLSNIMNLKAIREKGIKVFLSEEKIKWTCSNCGAILCMHKKECMSCMIPHSIKYNE